MESELYKLRTDLRADNFADSGGIRHIVVSDVLLNGRDVRKRLAIPSDIWQVAAALDGKSTPDQIRERVKAWYWREISPETIERITKALDQHYLLDNDRYRNHLQEITADLGRVEVRQAYPDPWSAGMNAEELRSVRWAGDHHASPVGIERGVGGDFDGRVQGNGACAVKKDRAAVQHGNSQACGGAVHERHGSLSLRRDEA